MALRTNGKIPGTAAPWLTERGLDLLCLPIDSVLVQALSKNANEFYSGCTLLRSMSHRGRVEAGVFLLGLLRLYSEDYARLTLIAEALWTFPTTATVDALASELRRVKGSSATRGYLGRIIDTLERFPEELVEEKLWELSSDPQVGPRFRQRLNAIVFRDHRE